MNQKEIILELFAAVHNRKGWFVSFKDAVSDLTAAQAALNSGTENHSIWQIAHHLMFWNRRWLDRFKGVKLTKMEGDNASTFSIDASNDNWQNTTSQVDEIFNEWIAAIKEKEEAELLKPVVEGEPDNWYMYLHTLALHNAYHIGQIITLRKTQDSWDPDQGVAS